MKLPTLLLALTIMPAHAAERSLPIERCCKSITGYELLETGAVAPGWVRAVVIESIVEGSDVGTFHIWDASCEQPRVRVISRAETMAEAKEAARAIPAGAGAQLDAYGLRDPELASTAKAICKRHGDRNG